ncbi:hypothetical protein HAX54_039237 [Datura stramonium]|uniref:Uncharacterized protein n=1 Tax=Datura stramonium TaxID=4076 RepID=A0ABS8VQ72_DATST|nr:hypothetical protein [Datura stramonium]
MGTMTIGYSVARSGEMQMKCRLGQKLASGHCLDSVLHRRFMDRDCWLADELLVEISISTNHQRFSAFCGSLPVAHRSSTGAKMSSSMDPSKGKVISTSRENGKGKAKDTSTPANTREAILFCVPNMKGHYAICEGYSIIVDKCFAIADFELSIVVFDEIVPLSGLFLMKLCPCQAC